MKVDLDLSPITVLIIDDSRYARSFIKSALNSFGVRQTVEVGDGPSGIDILRNRKIDLVLLDYEMSPMSGTQFARFVREGTMTTCVDIPIIMVSGVADAERVFEARKAGVNEFLAKPVSADSLFRRIRNVLVNPRPFVQTDTYIGPCRRTIDRDPPNGRERRIASPLPKPKPLLELAPGIAPGARHLSVSQMAKPPSSALAQSKKGTDKPPSQKAARKRFAAGELIFNEGDPGDEAYVIESGRVSIYKNVNDAEVVLGELGANGIFGEMALIDGQPRMASAAAIEDCVCMVLPLVAIKAQLSHTPDLVILVMDTLLHDIRKMGRELAEARARIRALRVMRGEE